MSSQKMLLLGHVGGTKDPGDKIDSTPKSTCHTQYVTGRNGSTEVSVTPFIESLGANIQFSNLYSN